MITVIRACRWTIFAAWHHSETKHKIRFKWLMDVCKVTSMSLNKTVNTWLAESNTGWEHRAKWIRKPCLLVENYEMSATTLRSLTAEKDSLYFWQLMIIHLDSVYCVLRVCVHAHLWVSLLYLYFSVRVGEYPFLASSVSAETHYFRFTQTYYLTRIVIWFDVISSQKN